MSVASVVTRGFSAPGSVTLVVTRGYSIGVAAAQTDTTGPQYIGAVRLFEFVGNHRTFEYYGKGRKS